MTWPLKGVKRRKRVGWEIAVFREGDLMATRHHHWGISRSWHNHWWSGSCRTTERTWIVTADKLTIILLLIWIKWVQCQVKRKRLLMVDMISLMCSVLQRKRLILSILHNYLWSNFIDYTFLIAHTLNLGIFQCFII